MELVHDKYVMLDKKIGSGGFSEVFMGKDKITGEIVAIKKVCLTQKNLQKEQTLNKLTTEIELMQTLDHPNIVRYYDVVKTVTHWYIIMEYCYLGTFQDIVKYNKNIKDPKKREKCVHYYLNQLKSALNYLREKGCIHRDIKPVNILLTRSSNYKKNSDKDNRIINSAESIDDSIGLINDSIGLINNVESINDSIGSINDSIGEMSMDQLYDEQDSGTINYNPKEKLVVKLADFGLAKSCLEGINGIDSLMNTICGSPLYMAPELFLNREYNSKSDLWSVGIVMYEMLFGKHPKTVTTMDQLINSHRTKKIIFEQNNYSEQCMDLIKNLLIYEPKKRMEWFNFFSHKWFSYLDEIKNIHKYDTIITKFKTDDSKPKELSDYDDYHQNNFSIPVINKSNPIKINNMSILRSNSYSSSNEPEFTPPDIQKNNDSYNFGYFSNKNRYRSKKSNNASVNGQSLSPSKMSSNLSKMKMEGFVNIVNNNYPKNYSDYPSSYPPVPSNKLLNSSIDTNCFSNSINLSKCDKKNNINSNNNMSKTLNLGNYHYIEAKSKSLTSKNNSMVFYVESSK